MLGFGDTLYLWRLERRWTQAALARRAGLPRPTVSALERGALEPTLRTIRRVAAGLAIRPGVLVDGQGPAPLPRRRFSRTALERMAAAAGAPTGAVRGLSPEERRLAVALRDVVRPRLDAWRSRCAPRRPARREHRSWLLLRELADRDTLRTLLDRVEQQWQRL